MLLRRGLAVVTTITLFLGVLQMTSDSTPGEVRSSGAVIDLESALSSDLALCAELEVQIVERSRCISDAVLDLAQTNGLERSVLALGDLASKFPDVGLDCHAIMHNIGEQAWSLFGEESLRSGKLWFCHMGYYHGLLPSLSESMESDLLYDTGIALCMSIDNEEFPDYNSALRTNCIHGVGHGLISSGVEVDAVVALCSQVPLGAALCMSGAVMEAWAEGRFKGVEDLGEVLSFCDAAEVVTLSGFYQECFGETIRQYVAWNGESIDVVSQYCANLTNPDKAYFCELGLGGAIGNLTGRALLDGDIDEVMSYATTYCKSSACGKGFMHASVVGAPSHEALLGICKPLAKLARTACEQLQKDNTPS